MCVHSVASYCVYFERCIFTCNLLENKREEFVLGNKISKFMSNRLILYDFTSDLYCENSKFNIPERTHEIIRERRARGRSCVVRGMAGAIEQVIEGKNGL